MAAKTSSKCFRVMARCVRVVEPQGRRSAPVVAADADSHPRGNVIKKATISGGCFVASPRGLIRFAQGLAPHLLVRPSALA
jgi:hypothetical protein